MRLSRWISSLGLSLLRFVVILMVLSFLLSFVRTVTQARSAWGTVVRGNLPNGDAVGVRSRLVGNESEVQLLWYRSGNPFPIVSIIQDIHAGPRYVVIKRSADDLGVWVEAEGRVLASLDLVTSQFLGEFERPESPSWVALGGGEMVAEGQISFLWQPFSSRSD